MAASNGGPETALTDIASALTQLAQLDRATLAQRWEAAFDVTPPRGCQATLLRLALAWHLQVQALGPAGARTSRQATQSVKKAAIKATENVKQLQEELTSTENKIGFARQLYNDVATEFNTRQMQFPTNLVAGLAKAEPAELWEIEDAGERAVPQVDLSMRPNT